MRVALGGALAVAAAVAAAVVVPAADAAATWHTGLPIAPDRVGLGPPVAGLGRGGEAVGAWTLPADRGRAFTVEVRARHGRLAAWTVELRTGRVPAGADALAAAMSPAGAAAVAWRASGGAVRVATRPGRRGTWTVDAVPSGPAVAGPAAFASPRVAVRDDGSADVVWAARENGTWTIRGAARTGGRGPWQPTAALTTGAAGEPSVALAADGGSAAAWSTPAGAVAGAVRAPAGAWTASQDLTAAGTAPSAAIADGGAAQVAWSATAEDGGPVVRVAQGAAASGFGAPEDGATGSGPRVAAGGGTLVLAWAPPGGGLAALVRPPAAAPGAVTLAPPGTDVATARVGAAAGASGRAAVTWVDPQGLGTASAGMATAAPGAPWRVAEQPVGEDVPAPSAAVAPDGDVLVLTAAVGRGGTGRTVLAASVDGAARPRLAGRVTGRRTGPRRAAWTLVVRNPSRVRAEGVRLRVRVCCGTRPVPPLPAGASAVRDGRTFAVALGTLPAGASRRLHLAVRLGRDGRLTTPLAEASAVAVPPVRLPGTVAGP